MASPVTQADTTSVPVNTDDSQTTFPAPSKRQIRSPSSSSTPTASEQSATSAASLDLRAATVPPSSPAVQSPEIAPGEAGTVFAISSTPDASSRSPSIAQSYSQPPYTDEQQDATSDHHAPSGVNASDHAGSSGWKERGEAQLKRRFNASRDQVQWWKTKRAADKLLDQEQEWKTSYYNKTGLAPSELEVSIYRQHRASESRDARNRGSKYHDFVRTSLDWGSNNNRGLKLDTGQAGESAPHRTFEHAQLVEAFGYFHQPKSRMEMKERAEKLGLSYVLDPMK